MKIRLLCVFPILAAVAASLCLSQQTVLAPTPPMGWNSWDSYGMTVSESEFKANAAWMASHLKRYGWQYMIVDEGWYLQNPESKGKPAWKFTLDGNGRFLPAPNRFPTPAGDRGLKPLADYVHGLGLRFGVHIIRGIPREAVEKNLPIAGSSYRAADAADVTDKCKWNADNYGVSATPAGQAYYDSLARMYAAWGLDFIKVDCISEPYRAQEIRMISQALKKSGRPIVLSLSPGPTPIDQAAEVRKYAQMWRISGDVWDHWGPWPGNDWSQGLKGQFAIAAQWAPHVETGHWPDADMLPIGYLGPRPGMEESRHSAFTPDEEQLQVTLWSMARSPLMMGGNLTRNDAWTTSLLTNAEVIALDQSSRGGHPVITAGDTVLWLAESAKGSDRYLAVFNLGDTQQTIRYPWKQLELKDSDYRLRDLWTHRELGSKTSLNVTLRPHASALYRLRTP